MKKFNLKKIAMMGLAAMMAVSAMSVSVFADEDKSKEIMAMSAEETRSHGFEVINGDIYDLDGNILIDLTDGKTADGFTIDPDFHVHYGTEQIKDMSDESFLKAITASTYSIFDGTKSLLLNQTGNEGVQLGSSFQATATYNICRMKYVSGIPTGVNFSVNNITKNSIVDWYPNISAGSYVSCSVYNSSRPNDYYTVYSSAEGSAGNVRLLIYLY